MCAIFIQIALWTVSEEEIYKYYVILDFGFCEYVKQKMGNWDMSQFIIAFAFGRG